MAGEIAFAGPTAIKNARFAAGVFVLAAGLSGCAGLFPQTAELRAGRPTGIPEEVELKQVPFFPQTEYQCGPAALATVLANAQVKITPEALMPEVYLPERKGSLQVEMLAATRRHGMVSYQLAPRFEDLLREIAAGNPVIVLQNFAFGPFGGWHYAVAIGYDYRFGKLFLRSGDKERESLLFAVHEFVWRRSGYWAMVAMPPGRIPATADEARWLASIAALERTGDARDARTAYESFLARWPANVNAEIGLANANYKLGDLKQAEAALRRAAAREPDSVAVLNNLAQTLSDQGRYDEALPIAERAVAAGGPFQAAAQETRAQILERIKQAADAAAASRAAPTPSPEPAAPPPRKRRSSARP